MAEDKIEMEGEVLEALGGGMFRVALDNGHELIAYTAGKMRRYRIRMAPGDRISVQVSPYDLNRVASSTATSSARVSGCAGDLARPRAAIPGPTPLVALLGIRRSRMPRLTQSLASGSTVVLAHVTRRSR